MPNREELPSPEKLEREWERIQRDEDGVLNYSIKLFGYIASPFVFSWQNIPNYIFFGVIVVLLIRQVL